MLPFPLLVDGNRFMLRQDSSRANTKIKRVRFSILQKAPTADFCVCATPDTAVHCIWSHSPIRTGTQEEHGKPLYDNEDPLVTHVSASQNHLTHSRNPLVYMDVALGPTSRPKRVVFQVYSNNCPLTGENFRALCTGEKGKSTGGKK